MLAGERRPSAMTAMNPTTRNAPPGDEREALEQSEKKASEKQPGSYKERATDDKIVEIPPTGPDAKPIRGLDSNEPARKR